jgi:DNA primase
MAGRIRDEDIELVRERTDIVKVVSQYLTLKKSGHDSYSGICPFHAEKTPSFSVSPSKGVYYCFGCGAGGDAVRFLRQIENLTFPEAVERLAREAGVTLRYEAESPAEARAASKRQALYGANEEAFARYHRTLMEAAEAEEARAYLKERGINAETAERFEIGFAPKAPDFLLRGLAKVYSADLLVEAGLVARDSDGVMRDRFRGRIVFPVRDLSGRAVGIGARVLPSSDQKLAKYLNSPETPVYRKGEMLYNLDRAKGGITRTGDAFVVEGYTDVVMLAQAGIDTAVATCGTALSDDHFRLLSRFARRAVLAFDSDEAGARAAERAFAFHENHPVQPVVLIMPAGQDPADFVRERGGEAFSDLAAGARPLVEYMIRRTVGRVDVSTVEGQSRAVDAALPILVGLSDPVRRQEYGHMVADLAGVSDDAVAQKLDRASATPSRPQRSSGNVQRPARKLSVQERTEREMLKLVVRDKRTFDTYAPQLTDEHIRGERNRVLLGTLRSFGGDTRAIVSTSEDESIVRSVSELSVEPLEGEPNDDYVTGVWTRLQEFALQQRSNDLRRKLQSLNPTTDDSYDGMFQELIALDGELRRIREKVARD